MINKKQNFVKAAALLGAAVMMISALAGCGKNTKVVLTAGLKKNEVFRISSASCVLPEVMVYLTNMQNQYESVYGSQIWNASDGQLFAGAGGTGTGVDTAGENQGDESARPEKRSDAG